MIIKYWNKFRFWLIRKIAGDSVSVIINMKIEGVTKYLKPVAFSAHSVLYGEKFLSSMKEFIKNTLSSKGNLWKKGSLYR